MSAVDPEDLAFRAVLQELRGLTDTFRRAELGDVGALDAMMTKGLELLERSGLPKERQDWIRGQMFELRQGYVDAVRKASACLN